MATRKTAGSKGRGGKSTLTRLQSHFLRRMEWYLDVREQCNLDPNCEDWMILAVESAIYSTYRDCEEQGIGEKAEILLYVDH